MSEIIKYKHISVIHHNLPVVAEMIVKYYDTQEYDNILFVINLVFNDTQVKELKKIYSRLIYYNLEHLSTESYNVQSNRWRPMLIAPLYAYDEVWDFLIENYRYYPTDIKTKYRFMPLRYIDLSCEKTEKTIDLFFVGVLDTPIRKEMGSVLNTMSLYMDRDIQPSIMIASGLYSKECRKLMRMSKFSIDFPHYRLFGNTQNTVRIHEAICSNTQVISYTDTDRVVNYFPDLINVISPLNGFDQDRTLELIAIRTKANI